MANAVNSQPEYKITPCEFEPLAADIYADSSMSETETEGSMDSDNGDAGGNGYRAGNTDW